MKIMFAVLTFISLSIISFSSVAQTVVPDGATYKTTGKKLFIDVHQLEPGKVKYEDVEKAHLKDLATEGKFGVHFIKYWVNEDEGLVYCLSSSADTSAIRNTHAEAHGLLPDLYFTVTAGMEESLKGNNNLYLDIHHLGAGKVSAKDVADAHKKDLAVQQKFGVNFINYWVDQKQGVVMCLAEASDSTQISKAHKEAHGLVPDKVMKVKQGE